MKLTCRYMMIYVDMYRYVSFTSFYVLFKCFFACISILLVRMHLYLYVICVVVQMYVFVVYFPFYIYLYAAVLTCYFWAYIIYTRICVYVSIYEFMIVYLSLHVFACISTWYIRTYVNSYLPLRRTRIHYITLHYTTKHYITSHS